LRKFNQQNQLRLQSSCVTGVRKGAAQGVLRVFSRSCPSDSWPKARFCDNSGKLGNIEVRQIATHVSEEKYASTILRTF
jgi:hypothetical protein